MSSVERAVGSRPSSELGAQKARPAYWRSMTSISCSSSATSSAGAPPSCSLDSETWSKHLQMQLQSRQTVRSRHATAHGTSSSHGNAQRQSKQKHCSVIFTQVVGLMHSISDL